MKKKGYFTTSEPVDPKLHALTPPRGPGKRQIKEEKLTESVEAILKKHRVEGFLKYEYVRRIGLQVVGFQINLLKY
jgi:hypothetical protein